MAEAATLRKKIAPARAPVPAGGSSVSAMLKKLLPRVADQVLSLDVLVGDIAFGKASKAELLDRQNELDLVYLLEDARKDRGICVVSPGLLAAVTEIQMAGRVSSREPPDRPPTRTDGIVAADIVDRWMDIARQAAEEEEHTHALPMLRFQRLDQVLNPRNADLALDPVDYETLSIDLSLSGGAKTGSLFFAVPVTLSKSAESHSAARVQKHLARVEAPMVAILARLPVKMSKVKALAIDDIIEVPIAALSNVQLEGMGGQKIASARLGQFNGKKALRLCRTTEGDDGATDADDLSMLTVAPSAAPDDGPRYLPEPDLPPTDIGDDLPDLPDLPEPGGLPPIDGNDLPPLPDPAAADPLSDLPDLPDLPELPDLPDLPELES